MELKIKSRKEFPLLNRERVNVDMSYSKEPTPKKNDVKKALSEFLKAEESLLEIKHIYNKFGANKSKVILNLYKDAKSLELFCKKVKVAKDGKEKGKE